MSAAKKFWDMPTISEDEMFYLDTLQEVKGTIIERMQWEGRQPDRGIAFVMHYWTCKSCRVTARKHGCSVVMLSKGKVLVASLEMRHNVLLFNSEYESLIDTHVS